MNICLKISEIQAAQKVCFETLKSGADTTECIKKLRFIISQTIRGLFAESRISEIKRKEWSTPQEYLDHSFKIIEKLKNTDSAEMLKFRNEIANHSLKIQLVPESAQYDNTEKSAPIFENTKIEFHSSFPAFFDESRKINVNSQYCEPGEPSQKVENITFAHQIEKAEARSFGVEIENERRIFYKENPTVIFETLEKLNGECNPVHEVINGQCRFFVDIDDKSPLLTRQKFFDNINLLMLVIPSYFNEFYNIADNYFNFYVAVSENPAYNSAHIYFDVFGLKNFSAYESKSPREQGSFWAALVHHLDKQHKTNFKYLVDLSVYKNKAQLRLPMTRKNGFLLRPLVAPVMFPVFEHAQYDVKNEFKTVLDNGTMTRELVSSETIHLGGKNKRYFENAEPGLNCFCANTQWIDNVIALESPETKLKIKHFTEYEKLLFERILRCSGLEIKITNKSNSNIFNGACYRIFCFYKTQPLENRINIATSYLKSKNVNLPVNKLFDEWESSGAYHPFSIDALKKFFVYEPVKKIIVNERHFKYPVWSGVLLLKSGTGTGKTYGFIEKVRGSTALFISCRISLSDEFKRSAENQGVKMVHYLEKSANEIIAEKPNHFCVQINSLYKFADILDHYEYIFIDESEALFSLFSHINATNPRSLPILKAMMQEIMKTKKTVLCSANLGDRTFEFVENFKVPFYYVENEILDKEGYSCQPLDRVEFLNKLAEKLTDNKKCVVPVSCVNDAVFVKQFIEMRKIKTRVLVQTSDTEKVPIEKWTNFDCVIYTSTIETGVSINYQYFDCIFGLFRAGINTYDSCFQMLFRVRHPTDKTVYVCADGDKFNVLPDRFDVKRATQSVVMTGQDNNATISRTEKIELFNNYVYKQLSDPIDKTLIMNLLFRNYSESYFCNLLFAELKSAGVKIFEKIKAGKSAHMPEKERVIAEVDKLADPSCGNMKAYLGIEKMINFGDITQKRGLEILCSIKNVAIGAKLTHREYACSLLMNAIGKEPLTDSQLNEILCEFFKNNYKPLSACFERRKYTLDHVIKMKIHNKKQYISSILAVCGLELENIAGCYTRLVLGGQFKSICKEHGIQAINL